MKAPIGVPRNTWTYGVSTAMIVLRYLCKPCKVSNACNLYTAYQIDSQKNCSYFRIIRF